MVEMSLRSQLIGTFPDPSLYVPGCCWLLEVSGPAALARTPFCAWLLSPHSGLSGPLRNRGNVLIQDFRLCYGWALAGILRKP